METVGVTQPVERKLATIRRIAEIRPIEGADQIEVAQIDGWQVVIAKSEGFKVGDLCIYCEIDSVLPEYEYFEFLRNKKFRIKTIRLKNTLSQGIIFPLDLLEKITKGQIIQENEDLYLKYNI